MKDLSFPRLFLAVFLLFVPLIVEFSIVKQSIATKLIIFSVIVSLVIVVSIRLYGHLFSLSYVLQNEFIRKHRIELVMLWFLSYFWLFSFGVGWYKPQLQKEYEMIHYKNEWHYILARYNTNLLLSKSFRSGSKRFIVYNSEQQKSYEINAVTSRL